MADRENATPEDVRQHLHYIDLDTETELTDGQIQYHLDTYATLLVDEELLGYGMSESRLQTIEALLGGHAILSSGIDEWRQASQERDSAGLQVSYAGAADGDGLHATTLGQRALELDSSGRLASLAESEGAFWSHTYTGHDRPDE